MAIFVTTAKYVQMKRIFFVFLLLLSSVSVMAEQIEVRNLEGRESRLLQGSSWGIPFKKGEVPQNSTFLVTDSSGVPVPSDSRTLAFWPDGSLKWVGFSAVTSGEDRLTVNVGVRRGKPAMYPERGIATMTDGGVRVNTGVIDCVFPSEGSSVIRDIRIGGKEIVSEARLVAVLESRDGERAVNYEDFESRIDSVRLCRNTPVQAVVKISGKHRSVSGDREWLPFTLYCTMYKGVPSISVTHTFRFDSDGRKDFVKGLGFRLYVPFREEVHNRHVRFAGDGLDGAGFWCQPVRLAPGYRPSAGRVFVDSYQEYLRGARLPDASELSESERAALETCPVWGDMRLVQNNPNSYSISKRTSPESSWVHYVDGGRSLGGALLGDSSGSVFLGIRNFWQSYPSALYVDDAGSDEGCLTAWLWSPDAEAMDMRHYDTVGHDLKINYEDYKEGWESPYGVGRRSDLELRLFDAVPDNAELLEVARAVQKPVQFSCAPEYFHEVEAFGDYWGLPDFSNPLCAEIERRLDMTLEYYKEQVDSRSWYGFWNYGDVMHNYDFTRHDWRYDIGGWAWNNIELAPNVLLWTCFLRTGREDIWTMAEAMEKHSSEVDVHHIGRFAPLGSRHNVTHWGDGCKQPRIEYAAMKRYLYYLTGGDMRTGELMTEQLGAEKAYDYARRVSTWGAVSGTYIRSSLNDWAYYAGNWMLEWERTGNEYYRDRLLNSMKDIVALGSLSGRLAFDYFDPETGRFMVYLKEDPEYRGTVDAPESDFAPAASLSRSRLERIVGYRLGNVRGDTFSTLFGAPELLTDIRATVDYPEFWKLADNSFRDISDVDGGRMTGPRMAAWVCDSENDAELGTLAWRKVLDRGRTDKESDGTPVSEIEEPRTVTGPDLVKPASDPYFMGRTAGWQRHTPSTVQWLLNAIEVMNWAGEYVPEECE